MDMLERQINDEGLWFNAQYVTEAHLQEALRECHTEIEQLRAENARLREALEKINLHYTIEHAWGIAAKALATKETTK